MKIDPHKSQERYVKWKKRCSEGIPGLTKSNSDLLLQYLNDMELGLNIGKGTKKGGRSYIRLNSLKEKLIFMLSSLEIKYDTCDITKVSERTLHQIFSDMRSGVLERKRGGQFKSTGDYVKIFKAFWHWHQKCQHKSGVFVDDITQDLDTSYEKPRWVYLTEQEVFRLRDNATFFYQVLITFLFDTGIRAPTELMNLRVYDLSDDYSELTIRSLCKNTKTVDRRIKLVHSVELIKTHIQSNQLNSNDLIFSIKPNSVNTYLKRLGKRLFGDKPTKAGKKYSELTMYDFRHISSCYWRQQYKDKTGMLYRFGWKKEERIDYYSEFLGFTDTINIDDVVVKPLGSLPQSDNTVIDENTKLKERLAVVEQKLDLMVNLIQQIPLGMISEKVRSDVPQSSSRYGLIQQDEIYP